MDNVVATYRLQFNPAFTFREAMPIIGYLRDLGISHVYASPVFAARPGSTHGYDVIAPDRINPELGSARQFEELLQSCRDHGLGWIQDIVPNHMAFASENMMLMDVLEYGSASPFARHFDIEWNHPYESLRGKVLTPFLGRFYGECLEAGEVVVGLDDQGLHIRYYDLRLPLAIESYPVILDAAEEIAVDGGDAVARSRLSALAAAVRGLPDQQDAAWREQAVRLKGQMVRVAAESTVARAALQAALARLNGTPGVPASYSALDLLLDAQRYRLSFWKVATEEINYRRFFNINQLISVRVEDEEVFRSTHAFLLAMLRNGSFSGVRVDHVDGLYDPAAYLRRLREAAPDALLYVEKILHPDEDLPGTWPVQGTTGYEFLNSAGGLLCDREQDRRLERIYERFIGYSVSFDQLVPEKKRLIIGRHMAGDVDRLAQLLKRITSADRYARDFTLYGLRRALVEILAWFPVYRTYVAPGTYSEQDRRMVAETLRRAVEASPALELEVRFIGRFLLLEETEGLTEEKRKERLRFVMSFQQLTGPLMAKGFEDTLLYIHNRLVSLNEVGGHPKRFGVSMLEFHQACRKRAQHWPGAMNATATHDTKRGEDTRVFIHVLSEMPDAWATRVSTWKKMNSRHRRMLRGAPLPDPNEEFLLYQTIIGTLPLDGKVTPEYRERIRAYGIKAVREAKVHTAWLKPDDAYEEGFLAFIDAILASEEEPFLRDLKAFRETLAPCGMLNALAQTVLKCTAPGVPDFYQGTELWDFSLVDPDNRREVDFRSRSAMLRELVTANHDLAWIRSLAGSWHDGRVKVFVIRTLLELRRRRADVFSRGGYTPLAVHGAKKRHLVAFARGPQTHPVITVVPRLTSGLDMKGVFPPDRSVWEDTRVDLPREFGGQLRNVFTRVESPGGSPVAAADILEHFPVAVLEG